MTSTARRVEQVNAILVELDEDILVRPHHDARVDVAILWAYPNSKRCSSA